jgi:hypothetical protein
LERIFTLASSASVLFPKATVFAADTGSFELQIRTLSTHVPSVSTISRTKPEHPTVTRSSDTGRAARTHDEAAQRHEEAARHWHELAEPEHADLERRNAEIERAAAQLERDRAALAQKEDQSP